MRTLSLFIFLTFSLFSKDYAMISKEIKINSFKKLNLDLPAKFLFYSNQKNNSVTLKMDRAFLDAVDITVKRDQLYIKASKNINTTLPITVIIHSKYYGLEEIVVQGVTDLNVDFIQTNHLSLISDGVSEISFKRGVINQLSINAKEDYIINFLNTDIKRALIEAEDTGEIMLNVSTLLNVKLSDLAKVSYHGHAKVIQNLEELTELQKR